MSRSQVGRVIQDCATQIDELVQKREYAASVRRFEALTEQLSPAPAERVAAALGHVNGKHVMAALARAFAFAPCAECDDGWVSCSCGRGPEAMDAGHVYCDRCGGCGRIPCESCGGGGFISFEAVPSNLEPAVANQRVHWTVGSLRDVDHQTAELRHQPGGSGVLPRLLTLFRTTRRIDAILHETSARLAAREEPSSGSRTGLMVEKSRHVNATYQQKLAEAISKYCHKMASRDPIPAGRRGAWQRRAKYFAENVIPAAGTSHGSGARSEAETTAE